MCHVCFRFAVVDMAGYERSWFVNPPEEVICGLCCNILREPRTTPCHHNYCSSCMSAWTAVWDQVVNCPVCDTGIVGSDVTRRNLDEDIQSLEVVCMVGSC